MKPAAQIQATIELLDEWDQTRYPADRVMARYFKQRRYIGSKDKAAISEMFYAVLRRHLSLGYLLSESDLKPDNRLRVALLIRLEGKALRDTFNGEQYCPARLSTIEQSVLKKIDTTLLQIAPVHVQLDIPEWIAPLLQQSLGNAFMVEIQASNQRATTDIRANLLKCSRAELLEALVANGRQPAETELSPWGVRFRGRVALFGLEAFRKGWFEVQDEGSQLLALLSAVKAGDKVVDFCAGAGGKTLAMSAMMENKGTIYACDVHSKRLEQLSKRARRAGAHNIRRHLLSSEKDKWVKQHTGIADLVLIDAPCSGTGTWRRSPDSRWNVNSEGLQELVALQASILDSASRLVRPGGRLLYATCSLLTQENEEQTVDFLRRHSEFEIKDLELPRPLVDHLHRFVTSQHELRTSPARTGTDGFYVASLQRKNPS